MAVPRVVSDRAKRGDTVTVCRAIIRGRDASAATAKLEVRAETLATPLVTLTSGGGGIALSYDATDTTVIATLSAAQTESLGAGTFLWDLELTEGVTVRTYPPDGVAVLKLVEDATQ